MTDWHEDSGTPLATPTYTYLDLEIRDPFPPSLAREEGWEKARAGQLGISVACLYESLTERYLFFDEHNLEKIVDPILASDCLVTFNGRGFDLPCLSGVLGYRVVPNQHYDLLDEIWNALGERRYEKGWGLGPTAERTLGLGKLGDGVGAIELHSAGRNAELYTYCLNDVLLTRKLFEHVMQTGHVIGPDGDKFCIRPHGLGANGQPLC